MKRNVRVFSFNSELAAGLITSCLNQVINLQIQNIFKYLSLCKDKSNLTISCLLFYKAIFIISEIFPVGKDKFVLFSNVAFKVKSL